MKEQLSALIADSSIPFGDRVTEFEKLLILDALQKNNWVKLQAAKSLKVTYRIFNYKFEKFGLQEKSPRKRRKKASESGR